MTIINNNELSTSDLVPVSPSAHPAEAQMDAVFSHEEVDQLKPMWTAIQTKFIDEPRKSVEEADSLVANTIQRLAESFAKERAKLESQWAKGDDISTEELRLALRRYRSFFDRLLST